MSKSSLRYGILVLVILAAGVLVNSWAYLGEAHADRKPLDNFPTQVGGWQKISDQVLDAETLKVLRASDYLLRDYRRQDGTRGNYYVGYYATQRDGASYHSPLNCLPGSGWTLSEPGRQNISLADGSNIVVNKYVIKNGDYKSLMLYWYQGRGRAVASEYWGKVYTVIDSVKMRRSDGALVRITVPIGASEDDALKAAMELAVETSAILPQFVPN